MIVAIDASNLILESGGFIHLKNILKNFDEKKISKLYVFSSKKIMEELNIKNKKIITLTHNFLNRGLFYRVLWQIFILNSFLKQLNCSVLFVPGGYFFFKKLPTFILIQNLLPFVKRPEYPETITAKIKNIILKYLHIQSIKKSNGIVFLSKHTKNIFRIYKKPKIIIPHGIEKQFFKKKKKFKTIKKNNKIKILYLSKFEGYKNHKNVILSIYNLLKKKYCITITLVGLENLGDKDPKLLNLINNINYDYPNSIILQKLKKHNNVHKVYRNYDLHVFGSMCESFGIIILETIASSLPIICSNFPVFKEILNNHTLYFDPKNPDMISLTIEKYIKKESLKIKNTKKLFQIAKNFKWKNSSNSTFKFIVKEYEKNKRLKQKINVSN